jgi:hypothetical protein
MPIDLRTATLFAKGRGVTVTKRRNRRVVEMRVDTSRRPRKTYCLIKFWQLLDSIDDAIRSRFRLANSSAIQRQGIRNPLDA